MQNKSLLPSIKEDETMPVAISSSTKGAVLSLVEINPIPKGPSAQFINHIRYASYPISYSVMGLLLYAGAPLNWLFLPALIALPFHWLLVHRKNKLLKTAAAIEEFASLRLGKEHEITVHIRKTAQELSVHTAGVEQQTQLQAAMVYSLELLKERPEKFLPNIQKSIKEAPETQDLI